MTSTYVALFSVWLHAIQIYFRASNTVYTVTFKGRLNPRFKLKSNDSRKSTTLLDKVPLTWLKISDAKQIHVKLYISNCFRTSAIVYLPRLMFYPSKSHVELITLRYFD